METWGGLIVNSVAPGGDLKQLYPNSAPVGVNPATATLGQQIRRPNQGTLGQVLAISDGVHSGTVEIWDINGLEVGADVSSGTTITNAQLVAGQTLGRAKLLWSLDFSTGNNTIHTPGDSHTGFMRGLAARYLGSGGGGEGAGAVKLNLNIEGGFYLTDSKGQ